MNVSIKEDERKMTSPTSPSKFERLSINVSQITAASLRRIAAKRSGSTITEVVRRAVAVLDRLERADEDGYELQLVNRRTKDVRIIELI